MAFFGKILYWSFVAGIIVTGVLTMLALAKIVFGVVGLMLGSTLGTIVLAIVIYKIVDHLIKSGAFKE